MITHRKDVRSRGDVGPLRTMHYCRISSAGIFILFLSDHVCADFLFYNPLFPYE